MIKQHGRKPRLRVCYLALALIMTTSTGLAESSSGELVITVHGLPSNDGLVRFGLYDSVETYDERKGAIRKSDLPIKDQTCTWRIQNLPYGEYALMLHHDENNNKKMDKNFIGIPKEGYGFSNNAKPGFRAPPYDKVKFRFERPQQTLEVQLQR